MSSKEKSKDDGHAFIHAVAKHQGWALHPDPAFLDDLAAGLAQNYNRYGYFLCPCRDGDGERSADKDIICPCVYAVPDQEEYGHCYCGLYLTQEFRASGKEPRQIPERRADSF
ncbi:MAG: ferredoxin-thioredoxin reductase catalytic domain-containing protein [Spirochaetales bacterium]